MNVKHLIAALEKLPDDSEIEVEGSSGNSMDDHIDTWYSPSFIISPYWRNIYRLEVP